MAFNIKETSGIRTACTGETKGSACWRINSSFEFSCVVLKRKSGKWRMITCLRVVNMVIQPMASLECRNPLSSLLPNWWPLIVTDFKDCFFTMLLQEKDREKFVFTVPTYNNSQPTKRYQWTILPQGMLNGPTLCQYFASQPLEIIHK